MTTPVLPSPLPAVTERRPAQPAAFRPQPGPGYVAKYGPVRDDDVFWTNPDTGVRYHGNAELARANAISVFLELDEVTLGRLTCFEGAEKAMELNVSP